MSPAEGSYTVVVLLVVGDRFIALRSIISFKLADDSNAALLVAKLDDDDDDERLMGQYGHDSDVFSCIVDGRGWRFEGRLLLPILM